ncbi:hypothetical protein CC78DRAFT_559589 [Lojkania enalia]|uniref:Spindle pole body component n=1 Tax=Lojkania enalia TaxID=147567 RepID=A0A9P4N1C4_9PLEO|nr:hypothetical protein CC78DRAFT_559589 [Didymosphaeria enalia]
MDDEGLIHDVFSSDSFWKPSTFLDDPTTYESSLFTPLEFDVPSIRLDHPYAPKNHLDSELCLPDLDAFEFGQLPELESLDQSSLSIETPPLEPEEDIWRIALELGPANKDVVFFSWEGFENLEYDERRTCYITEAGPQAFDAALAKDDGNIPTGRVVRGDVLLESIFNLGLGRSSLLFNFDPRLKSFVPAIRDGRASGLSLQSAQSLINRFILTGNAFLYLRSFVERTFASMISISAMVALATCVSSILSSFEHHLGRHRPTIRSLLQLQRLFARPQRILNHIARLVDAVRAAKSNEHLASILHHRVLELEEGEADLRQLSTQILRRVAGPSLEVLGEWIGIRKEQNIPIVERCGFVAVEDKPENEGPLEYSYNPEMMPRFVSPEDGDTIFETGNSLRFLKLHHPEHPLVSCEKFGVQPPDLEWEFAWEAIETISRRAKDYEEALRRTILNFNKDPSLRSREPLQPPLSFEKNNDWEDVNDADFRKYIEETAQLFDQDPGDNLSGLPDQLQILTEQILSNTPIGKAQKTSIFPPPLSITSMLSFRPLLTAQAKLINATTLRLFFRSHQLHMHLSLQRQYQLFGDGVFSSLLSSALFDPERETAERRKGTMRSGVQMGLQLGSRSNWPPASSELRLALMGVLSESFYSSTLYASSITKHSFPPANQHVEAGAHKRGDELPGQLNFAVRQLDEREMERIMDPDSLYALDFLRLQYVPPSPLNLIITSASLEKYDYIFKFLLRLSRMLFVISHLPRLYSDPESRKFRLEAHHFVAALATYIFQTGIAEHWERFSSFISAVETRLEEEDLNGELGTRVTEGIEALKSAHEKCLDSIMFSLLLRRRQKKLMALLEEIFENILTFAKTQNENGKIEESVSDLYGRMKGKIKVFISVCRGLMGKRGYGMGRGSGEENTVERLLVVLEMNGYYVG